MTCYLRVPTPTQRKTTRQTAPQTTPPVQHQASPNLSHLLNPADPHRMGVGGSRQVPLLHLRHYPGWRMLRVPPEFALENAVCSRHAWLNALYVLTIVRAARKELVDACADCDR